MYQTKNQELILRKYESMGFPLQMVIHAYERCKGDETQMLDILVNLNQQLNKPMTRAYSGNPGDDIDVNKAIELSLKEQKKPSTLSYEPLNAEQRLRKSGMPIGLKNVGNSNCSSSNYNLKACYVNSLFQTYFSSHKFVQTIMDYNPNIQFLEEDIKSPNNNKGEKDIKKIRIKASISLIKNLQKLFTMMIRSHKKYVDPTDVLNSVVDDMGQPIPIGDQKDVTEYHLNFLSRIEEGLYYQEKYQKMTTQSTMTVTGDTQMEDAPAGYLSVSIGKFASSNQQENSMIMKHYFGKQKQFRSYIQDGEKITQEEETVFGPIIVDIAHKELYSAFEHYCHFTIDDFRAPNGEITKAESDTWLTRPPECMFFQLQRVTFDVKSGQPCKLNDKFAFEKEIYLDRFLLQHREEAGQINREIAILKEKLEQQERSLKKMINYKESNLDIINVLGIASDFLKNQVEFDMNSAKMFQLDPTIIGHLDEKGRIDTAVNIIDQYKGFLEKKMNDLRNNIANIKDQISKLNSKLCKQTYHLVAILVHDGVAGTGHYYSFNRNITSDTWKRYNDIYVSEENEETVFRESFGGHNNTSAYCLVYISDKVFQEELGLLKQKPQFETSTDLEIEKKHYNLFLKTKLLDETEAENLIFHEEIEEFRFNNCLRSILDTYKVRYDMVTQALQSKTTKSPPTHLNSFGSFLKYDPHFETLLKWYILDGTLQDSQLKTNLRNMKTSRHLLTMLANRLSSLSRPYNFTHLVLSKEEENKLDCKLAEYSAEYPVFIYTKFLLNSSLSEKWRDSCYAMKCILDMETNPQSYIHKLVKDVAKIGCLKLALMCERLIKSGQIDLGLEYINYLIAIVKGVLKPEDVQVNQVKQIMKDALVEIQGKVQEGHFKRINEEVFRLGSAFHVSAELDKVIKEFSPKDLELEIQNFASENLYNWRDINENSPSNVIKKMIYDFSVALKMFVEFHNYIHNNKGILKLEDRKKLGYFLV